MIETVKNYKLTITEEQARQLYNLLHSTKSTDKLSYGGPYSDLSELHLELKQLFDNGIRNKETDNYPHIYAPGTK